MDELIRSASRALSAGDALAALNLIALRDDASALALRGIAIAQLGNLELAKSVLRKAIRAFPVAQATARARCVVALAEIAFASRDVNGYAKALDAARATLEAQGDLTNAAHAGYIQSRRLLLLGRVDEAERGLIGLRSPSSGPASRAVHSLIVAGIALRRLQVKSARRALDQARRAALHADIRGLKAEIDDALRALDAPAARRISHGREQFLRLDDIEALYASQAFIVDGCRQAVRCAGVDVPLVSRPVLFTLAQLLAQAWPKDISRDALISQAFRTRSPDETHRARLRVEIGRLRKTLHAIAAVSATKQGYALMPHNAREVTVLAPPVDDRHAGVLALLADGQSWASSALALALGASQRNVQRALDALRAEGQVQPFGRGRARRWTSAALPGFTTALLLPVPISSE
jgi:tetratricopeptide (TPR) repeat protein